LIGVVFVQHLEHFATLDLRYSQNEMFEYLTPSHNCKILQFGYLYYHQNQVPSAKMWVFMNYLICAYAHITLFVHKLALNQKFLKNL
jgi:hypothetical protein